MSPVRKRKRCARCGRDCFTLRKSSSPSLPGMSRSHTSGASSVSENFSSFPTEVGRRFSLQSARRLSTPKPVWTNSNQRLNGMARVPNPPGTSRPASNRDRARPHGHLTPSSRPLQSRSPDGLAAPISPGHRLDARKPGLTDRPFLPEPPAPATRAGLRAPARPG